MNNLIQSAPENQKEKISKLLDIWQRGQTFPTEMLAKFKQQLNGGQNSKLGCIIRRSRLILCSDTHEPATSPQTSNSVGYAVNANIPPVAAPPPEQTAQDPAALYAALAAFGQQNSQTNAPSAPPSFPFLQPMVAPPPPPGFVPPPPPPGANGHNGLPAPPAGLNDLTSQILQAMKAGSIAPEQAIQVLNALAASQNGGASLPPSQPPAVSQAFPAIQPVVQYGNLPDRYDPNDTRMRDRSRSPDFQRRRSPARRSPQNANRRESPTYGVYDPNAASDSNAQRSERGDRGRGRGKQRGGRNEYRQRSPPRRQSSPPRAVYGQSKYIEWDDSLPRDHIRVLSRTLFVGGAGGTEGEIRTIFARFGRVQTCIVNQDKRHAFVKMLTRPDAVAAKEGMDSLQDSVAQSKARQVRMACRISSMLTNFVRPAGVSDLDHAIAATIRLASA